MNPTIQPSINPNCPVQTSEPKLPRKGFRLYKRADNGRELSPGAPGYKERDYYFRFTFKKVSYARCLETNDGELAQKHARAKAKEIKEAVVRSDYAQLDRTKLRAAIPGTVAELVAVYAAAPLDAEEATRIQNVHALRQLLRTTYFPPVRSIPGPESAAEHTGSPAPELQLRISQIDATVPQAWFTVAGRTALAAPEQAQKTSLKRSANSRWIQAKSLFTPKALAAYRAANLYHPAFEAFLAAGETFKFSKLPATGFNPPADAILQATLAAWDQVTDRNLYLAIGHELAFGLRIGELGQARWNWWTTREGYPVLDNGADDVTVKNCTGLIQVRALDPWFTALHSRIQSKGWNPGSAGVSPASSDYILTGTATDRNDNVPRLVSAWLRQLGWETRKTNHELRKYAGSQIAMKYGIYEAQCWLRHSTVKVTEQHYAGYVKRFKPANLDAIPARWAQAPAANIPQLRILEASA